MNTKTMKAVLADEAFVKSLFELETAAEVQAALNDKGIALTEAEVLGIRDLLAKVESGEVSDENLAQWAQQAESDELSDEVLEQIAGGLLLTGGALLALTIVCGLAGGGAVGGTVFGVAHAIKNRW